MHNAELSTHQLTPGVVGDVRGMLVCIIELDCHGNCNSIGPFIIVLIHGFYRNLREYKGKRITKQLKIAMDEPPLKWIFGYTSKECQVSQILA